MPTLLHGSGMRQKGSLQTVSASRHTDEQEMWYAEHDTMRCLRLEQNFLTIMTTWNANTACIISIRCDAKELYPMQLTLHNVHLSLINVMTWHFQ